jgi:hypothetical protein
MMQSSGVLVPSSRSPCVSTRTPVTVKAGAGSAMATAIATIVVAQRRLLRAARSDLVELC